MSRLLLGLAILVAASARSGAAPERQVEQVPPRNVVFILSEEVAGVAAPDGMQGRSILPALRGEPVTWEGELLYEYYWEYAFPHTPTTLALRADRYKFIYYPRVWDIQELYDLQADPKEQHNLIDAPEEQERVTQMRTRLWDLLDASGGMSVPLERGRFQANQRKGDG